MRVHVGMLVFLFACGACRQSFQSAEELTAYVQDEENGLKKSFTAHATTLEVNYRPTDLWVAQEAGKEKPAPEALETLRRKYDAYYYFVLSLSHNNKEALHQAGPDQYSDLVQTMSFRMGDYVTLTTSARDTIPVGDFMLNRTYGLSSSTDILFVFNKEKAKGADWVQFNLNEFGLGVGNQRFRFETKDLENIPSLAF